MIRGIWGKWVASFGVLGVAMLTPVMFATSASAAVQPVGKVKLNMSVTLTETIQGNPTDIGPISGTATGTVDANGNLKFPKANIKFAAFPTNIIVDVTLKPSATADWTGTVDPKSGTVSITAQTVVLIDITNFSVANCPIGPSTWNLFGKGYNAKTGAVQLSDPSFDIPALDVNNPDVANNCGGQSTVSAINGSVGLPATGVAAMSLTISPAISGVGTVATTTIPPSTTTTTTTVPATTPATVTQQAAGNQLPRTGSSTMPLLVASGVFVLSGLGLASRRRRGTYS